MADEFQVVVRSKRRQKFSKLKKHLQETQQISQTTTRDDKEENDGFSSSSLKSLINILEDCSKEIALTNFYKTFKDILLVKLHRGSKCEQHPPSFLRTVQNDSPKPPSAEDSTADLSRATSSESNEETDLEIPQIQDSDKIASSGLESSESSSSFPFSCAEAISSQLDHLDGFVENADHCKELAGLELVIYGIGNYADCLIARYQFALMLALRKTLKLPQARLLVFDPRLSNIEKSVINELGLALISHNEEGKRPGSDKHWTLFFMPHCGKALCNNLLWANWSPHQLANIIIIGNSFSSIIERSPERLLKEYYYYIWKIYSITDETSLPNSFKHADVFNDTSIHCFRSVELSQLPEDFWREHTEPVYDSSDLEIIVNK